MARERLAGGCVHQVEACGVAVRAADRERPAVRAEGQGTDRLDDCSDHADLAVAGDRAADSLQRARVEEDDAAVISADRKRTAVAGQRVVEGPVTTPVHDRERSRAANERGKQVAARGR